MFCRVSIEILPGDATQWCASDAVAFPFLFVDGNLGLPQKVLYKVYMVAVGRFNSSKKGDSDVQNTTRLVDSSSIILLVNPAHQTALNTRKRLVQNLVLSPGRELLFVTALLRVRDCAKQSIVWDYRRWLLQHLYGTYEMQPSTVTVPSSVPALPSYAFAKEFEIISRACETYPRNYHAWAYWHFIMETLFLSVESSDSDEKRKGEYIVVLTDEFQHLRQWVEQHISDYSAMHQFCYLVRRYHHIDSPHIDLRVFDAESLFDHAISLVTAYPSHESLWLYLRVALYVEPEIIKRTTMIAQAKKLCMFDGQLGHKCLAWWDLQVSSGSPSRLS